MAFSFYNDMHFKLCVLSSVVLADVRREAAYFVGLRCYPSFVVSKHIHG